MALHARDKKRTTVAKGATKKKVRPKKSKGKKK